MEEKFWNSGKVEEVKEILRNNPRFNINWKNKRFGGWTALHAASTYGHDSIVSILLAHPDIDVNLKDRYGRTPFWHACWNGRTSCVRLLLEDQRVKVHEPDNKQNPLWRAADNAHLDIIKWWIASGREMDLDEPEDWKTDKRKEPDRSGDAAGEIQE